MATIRKRGNKWQVQVRKHGYSPFSKSFTNRKDAELWAKSIEIQLEKGLLPTDNHDNTLKNLTLGQLVKRYIENVTVHKKSCHMETTILKAFLRHPICSISLKKLSSEDFARYRDERLQKIKPETLKRQLTPLKNMLRILEEPGQWF